jgi:zinc transport system substrate-binding protein
MTLFLISCKSTAKDTVSDNKKLQVYVSFNALHEFASAVGQNKAEVYTIVPTGTEPHDFEPKAADIAGLSKANVFIFNGLGMEAWAEKAIEAAENDGLTVIVASDGANVIEATDEEEIEEHGQYDPHTWLSLKEAEIEVQNIADGFSTVDPDNKDYYLSNAANYIKKLEDIFNEYNDKFSDLENKYFVTGHAAFNYFCRDFGLEQNSVEDVFAEGEPSSKQLADLIEYCKENNVSTIFAEEMASPEISETLANEVGAKVQTIYTMESPEDELTYLERIKENCERVFQSLTK